MKTIALVLLLSLPSTLYAKANGQALIDSLVKELGSARYSGSEDTNKAKILKKIARVYETVNPDEAMRYDRQFLELSKKLQWKKGMANAYTSLGVLFSNKSDFAKALENYFEALKLYEELKYKDGESRVLTNIGTIYSSQDNSAKALDYFEKAMKICEEINDKEGTATNLTNIGNVYYQQRKDSMALEYDFRAVKIYEQINNKEQLASTLTNIGALYHSMHREGDALEYALKSLKINEQLGDKRFIAVNYGNIGNTYLTIAKASSSGRFQEIKNAGEIATANKASNIRKAIEYLDKSIELCKEIGFLDPMIVFSKDLSEAYELSGNYKEALEHYSEYTRLKDSVYSTDSKIKIANLATKREEDLKKKQIEINALEQNKKRNERSLFMVGLGLLLVVVVVVVRNYNTQKKANKEKGELLRQKDVLMKEIHHRVKNNLQVIGALLDLQLSSITDEHAKDAMTESTTRVRSISLIHQQLYQNENLRTVEFSRFAKDLLHELTSVFKKPGQNITLKNDIPETVLDIDTAVPLGLIVNELMTNSYKYAFAGADGGTIEITMAHDNGNYRLVYKDSGPGLSKDLNVSSLQSMGMKVMHSLSKQIGGTFTYNAIDKSFIVTFKDQTGRKLID
jgi:two-component system, sensor histidine kinase PdtaS